MKNTLWKHFHLWEVNVILKISYIIRVKRSVNKETLMKNRPILVQSYPINNYLVYIATDSRVNIFSFFKICSDHPTSPSPSTDTSSSIPPHYTPTFHLYSPRSHVYGEPYFKIFLLFIPKLFRYFPNKLLFLLSIFIRLETPYRVASTNISQLLLWIQICSQNHRLE